MNWNKLIRQLHRWLSMALICGMGVYIAAMRHGQPPGWVGLFPVTPFVLLLATGLYLFVLPYALRWRAPRRAG